MADHSSLEDFSFYDDEENYNNKTFVTVNADSFSEKDFNSLLNCLDTIRESENKRRKSKKVIKNYCVQVPYIDNSILKDEDDNILCDDFDKTCDEMKKNISQMFSYFDEDVHLDYDGYDKHKNDILKNERAISVESCRKQQNPSDNFREKFLRNHRKIKELGETKHSDTKPIIRGVIKKPNAPRTPNTSLNKNQVDKIMNEFNRVKINYYSKENFVEFTNIDYFYCDSDLESIRSEKVGKIRQNVLSKFEPPEADDNDKKSPSKDIEVVPKNSVRDKINMFSKLDKLFEQCDRPNFYKSLSAPRINNVTKKQQETFQRKAPTGQLNSFKNSAAANKNQNKCYIKDVNNSLRYDVKNGDELDSIEMRQENSSPSSSSSKGEQMRILEKLVSNTDLNDIDLLIKLELVVNKFGMSLLHTFDGLMKDEAFTLVGKSMIHLNVETCPSIEQFNKTFDGNKINTNMENIKLSVIETNKIQLQFQVTVNNVATGEKDSVNINVIFMAQYESDGMVPDRNTTVDSKTFFIYFTSLFEVLFFDRETLSSLC